MDSWWVLAPPTRVDTDMDAILATEEASRQMNLTLKEKQKEAVLTVLQRKDVFCVLLRGLILYRPHPVSLHVLVHNNAIVNY